MDVLGDPAQVKVGAMTDVNWVRPGSASQQGHIHHCDELGERRWHVGGQLLEHEDQARGAQHFGRGCRGVGHTVYDILVWIRVLIARVLGLGGATWADEARQVPAQVWIECRPSTRCSP